MINNAIQEWARGLAKSLVRPLVALGVGPNAVTTLGLILNFVTAFVIAGGNIFIGGILVLSAGIFDMFDGAVARVTGTSSTFGAFFDSTLDRISEAAIGLGILLYFTASGNMLAQTTIYAMIIGSLMVSYTRARAEGLGLDCKIGLMARPERVIALGVGLMLGAKPLIVILVLVAISSWFTVIQRIVHVWSQTRS